MTLAAERLFDFSPAETPAAPPVRSPGLELFRLNPFRVFRLPVSVVGPAAQWQAEKIVTRSRAGAPIPEANKIPWLPEPDEIELGEAVQVLEEPLRRLVEQISWFDFEIDPGATTLVGVLRGESLAMKAFSEVPEPPPFVLAADATGSASDLPPEAFCQFVSRINQANACLLIAWAHLSRTGPIGSTVPTPETLLRIERPKDPADADVMLGVHRYLSISVHSPLTATWLEAALNRWSRILGDGCFGQYVFALMQRLGDDVVGAEDVATICAALQSRLLDQVVREIKGAVLAGRVETAEMLLSVAAKSAIDTQAWKTAFRPLRYVFRSELDEIRSLATTRGLTSFDDLDLFLVRLRHMARRWKNLDKNGLLGLGPTIDEGVNLALDHLRAIQSELSAVDRLARIDDFRRLFTKAAKIATSQSLKERVQTARGRLDAHLDGVCHYCMRRESGEHPVVLDGKKEVNRTRTGNTTTIHYEIRRALVPRCNECAEYHDWLHQILWRSAVAIWVAILLCGLAIFGGPGWGTPIDVITHAPENPSEAAPSGDFR